MPITLLLQRSPVGLIFDNDGSVIVSSPNSPNDNGQNGQVFRFKKPDTSEQSMEIVSNEKAFGLAVDKNFNIYGAIFAPIAYVMKITRDGKTHELGKGQFKSPISAVAVLSNGWVLVNQAKNDRIAVIKSGRVSTWKIVKWPGGLAVDKYDQVYVCEHGTGKVLQIETEDGEPTEVNVIAENIGFATVSNHPYSDIAVAYEIE
jgi:DNA-binding beta-propeller fold protein YncE